MRSQGNRFLEIKQLGDAVLKSEAFQHSRATRVEDLLQYLTDHWTADTDDAKRDLSEKQIGVAVFGEPKDWDPFTNSIVRANKHRLRARLRGYFLYTQEGRKCPRRLELSERGPYQLQLVPNVLELKTQEKFWDSHAINGAPNLIVYTEPLWFWDGEHRRFVRYLDINCDALENLDNVLARFPEEHEAHKLVPCFHYQASGEIQAVHHIEQWFRQNQIEVGTKLARKCLVGQELWANNLIVLGNHRGNRFVQRFQMNERVRLDNDGVFIQDDAEGLRFTDQQPERNAHYQSAHVVITRRPSEFEKRSVTVLASNNGRALERAAETLTSNRELSALFGAMKLDEQQPMPAHFQIVLKVNLRLS